MKNLLNTIKQPRVWLAVFLFVSMCTVVLALGYWCFDWAFYSYFSSALLIGIINLSGWNGHIKIEEHGDSRFLWRILAWVILVCAALLLSWGIYIDKYYLLGYQGLTLIALLVILDVRRHTRKLEKWTKYSSNLCSAMCAVIILSTVLFIAIARPITMRGAEHLLADAGYENPVYIMHLNKNLSRRYYVPSETTGNSVVIFNGPGVYLLSGEYGGEEYGVLVSVTQGEIVWAAPLAEDSFIAGLVGGN